MKRLLFISLLLSLPAYGNSGAFVISKITVENGNVYIYSDSISNPNNCELTNYVKIDRDSLGFKEMYGMALTAFTTSSKIGFWSAKCGVTPWGKTANVAYNSYLTK